jgi:hypothetical protein
MTKLNSFSAWQQDYEKGKKETVSKRNENQPKEAKQVSNKKQTKERQELIAYVQEHKLPGFGLSPKWKTETLRAKVAEHKATQAPSPQETQAAVQATLELADAAKGAAEDILLVTAETLKNGDFNLTEFILALQNGATGILRAGDGGNPWFGRKKGQKSQRFFGLRALLNKAELVFNEALSTPKENGKGWVVSVYADDTVALAVQHGHPERTVTLLS